MSRLICVAIAFKSAIWIESLVLGCKSNGFSVLGYNDGLYFSNEVISRIIEKRILILFTYQNSADV
jgi:hypothetical protein